VRAFLYRAGYPEVRLSGQNTIMMTYVRAGRADRNVSILAAVQLGCVWLSINYVNARARRFYEKPQFQGRSSIFFHLENEQHENSVLFKRPGPCQTEGRC